MLATTRSWTPRARSYDSPGSYGPAHTTLSLGPKSIDFSGPFFLEQRLKGINTMLKILILNGPNLNLLGTRQPEVYGTTTLADVEQMCADKAVVMGITVECRQTNHEGVLVDWIQAGQGRV